MKINNLYRKNGHTLIEMLIVAAIIGIICSPIVAVTIYTMQEGKIGSLKSEQQNDLRLAVYSLYKDIKNCSNAEIITSTSEKYSNLKLYFKGKVAHYPFEYVLYIHKGDTLFREGYKGNKIIATQKIVNNLGISRFDVKDSLVRCKLQVKSSWNLKDFSSEIETIISVSSYQ